MKKSEVGRWIGKKIKIEKSANKNLEGIQGEVIDETKNMIIIKTSNGEKKIIKSQIQKID